jgi:hypothetical protein
MVKNELDHGGEVFLLLNATLNQPLTSLNKLLQTNIINRPLEGPITVQFYQPPRSWVHFEGMEGYPTLTP